MTDWTLTDFGRLGDKSPSDAPMTWKMARGALRSSELGVSRFSYEPGAHMPFTHRHREQEEVYIVVGGSGRARLDDGVIELDPWEASTSGS